MGIGQRSFFKKLLSIQSISQQYLLSACLVLDECVGGHLPGRRIPEPCLSRQFLNNRGVGIGFGEWPQSGESRSEREVDEACEPGRLIKRLGGSSSEEANKACCSSPTATARQGQEQGG